MNNNRYPLTYEHLRTLKVSGERIREVLESVQQLETKARAIYPPGNNVLPFLRICIDRWIRQKLRSSKQNSNIGSVLHFISICSDRLIMNKLLDQYTLLENDDDDDTDDVMATEVASDDDDTDDVITEVASDDDDTDDVMATEVASDDDDTDDVMATEVASDDDDDDLDTEVTAVARHEAAAAAVANEEEADAEDVYERIEPVQTIFQTKLYRLDSQEIRNDPRWELTDEIQFKPQDVQMEIWDCSIPYSTLRGSCIISCNNAAQDYGFQNKDFLCYVKEDKAGGVGYNHHEVCLMPWKYFKDLKYKEGLVLRVLRKTDIPIDIPIAAV